MPRIAYGTSEFEYTVRTSADRTTVDIAADPEKGVIVTSPRGLTQEQLELLVLRKAPWILSKLKRAGQVMRAPPQREYVSGESFYYLGRSYRLKVIEDESTYPFEIKLVGGRFLVRVPPNSDLHPREVMVSSALRSWFAQRADTRLRERVAVYLPKVGVEPRGVVVKNQMKRWGTCTKDGVMYLNWRVVMAPMSVVDYIVVHELLHLKVKNHSPGFWLMLRSVIPDYERRKEWLRVNGSALQI